MAFDISYSTALHFYTFDLYDNKKYEKYFIWATGESKVVLYHIHILKQHMRRSIRCLFVGSRWLTGNWQLAEASTDTHHVESTFQEHVGIWHAGMERNNSRSNKVNAPNCIIQA